MAQPAYLPELKQMLVQHFNAEELKSLCFDLGLDRDRWPPSGKEAFVENLLTHLDQTERLDELIVLLRKQRPNVIWPSAVDDPAIKPPYKGLEAYGIADAHLFFGREALTAQLVAALASHRFLAVVGASGSGKSSLVLAGVVAALQAGKPLADGCLPPFRVTPALTHVIRPGAHPLKALATSLTRKSRHLAKMPSCLGKWIRQSPDTPTRRRCGLPARWWWTACS